MCVDGRGQAVVVEVAVHAGAEVHSLHHAPGGQDAQQCVEVRETIHCGHIQRVSQRLRRVCMDLQALWGTQVTKPTRSNLSSVFQLPPFLKLG